jgi:hypothetical protein
MDELKRKHAQEISELVQTTNKKCSPRGAWPRRDVTVPVRRDVTVPVRRDTCARFGMLSCALARDVTCSSVTSSRPHHGTTACSASAARAGY